MKISGALLPNVLNFSKKSFLNQIFVLHLFYGFIQFNIGQWCFIVDIYWLKYQRLANFDFDAIYNSFYLIILIKIEIEIKFFKTIDLIFSYSFLKPKSKC